MRAKDIGKDRAQTAGLAAELEAAHPQPEPIQRDPVIVFPEQPQPQRHPFDISSFGHSRHSIAQGFRELASLIDSGQVVPLEVNTNGILDWKQRDVIRLIRLRYVEPGR